MPIMEEAEWRPLSENKRQPNHKKTLVIVHSAVARGSLFNFFENRSDLESTFWASLGGDVEQYLDSLRRADANKSANGLAISIENEDNGDPDRQAMPDAQVQANIDIINWAIEEEAHDISRCRATGPAGTGVGYHTMWGAPSLWTPVAKTCPGRRRVEQFEAEILPEILRGTPMADTQFTEEDRKMMQRIHDVLFVGIPSHGVPPLAEATTFMSYSIGGIDLENRPSLVHKLQNFRDSLADLSRELLGVPLDGKHDENFYNQIKEIYDAVVK